MGPRGEVPLEPIRERWQREDITIAELSRRTGIEHTHLSRLMGKTLGYSKKDGRTYRYKSHACSYENGCKLALALGMDPHEAGV